jgi:hypothetical protein
MAVGEENLGSNARRELADARRDPRINRKRGEMIADFWSAFEEAERVRSFGIAGLHELRSSLERAEKELQVLREDDALAAETVSRLQIAWEQSEMARAEIEAGHPHLNGQALLAINSALDSLVEELAPALRTMRIGVVVDKAFQGAKVEEAAAFEQVSPQMREAVLDAARKVVEDYVPEPAPLRGKGLDRYESILGPQGLGAPEDRPIPDDLAEALRELGAIRDVLVHRAGRIDPRALRAAPSLRRRYEDGELVRISRDDYRTYSAAVRCYAREILYRPLRGSPAADDERHGPRLSEWRRQYRISA